MWQSQISLHVLSLFNLNLCSNTRNLTYFAKVAGKPDSGRLAPLSFCVWLAIGLCEIVVNLSRRSKVLCCMCDAAAFDVLILSHWRQNTSALLILPRGSALHSLQEADWQCLTTEEFTALLGICWQTQTLGNVWIRQNEPTYLISTCYKHCTAIFNVQ